MIETSERGNEHRQVGAIMGYSERPAVNSLLCRAMQVDALQPTQEFLAESEQLGLAFEPGDLESLGRFLALLLEANKAFNLTAITDPAQAWRRHILDALTLIPLLSELPEVARVIDVGSGGGVPGIPVAIALPALSMTLLEPTGKKAAFLSRACGPTPEGLGLSNVRVLNDRAEKIGQDHKLYREQFDAAIVRAVGPLSVIAELAGPLVKVGGVMLAIKGEKSDAELAEASEAMASVGLAHDQTIQTPTGRIVVLVKQGRTPRQYPRPDGEPKRKPLGTP